MPEHGAIGEESAHLELRVDALFEATEQLQDELVAEGHRRVALIAPAELRLERSLAAEPREPFGSGADEPSSLAARHASALDHLEERHGQRRIPEAVHKEPGAVGGLDPRHDELGADVLAVFPPRQRDRIGGGFAFRERHVDEGDHAAEAVAIGALDADRVRDRHGGDLPALGAEPALPNEEPGQRSLEVDPCRPLQHRVPRAHGPERGNGRGRDLLFTLVGLEAEPEVSVRPQGDEVRELADPGELGGTEQLDRHLSVEAREIQLDELRAPREVGDHEGTVVTERAQEGHHLAVLGVEELDVAAREGRGPAGRSDQAPHPPQERRRIVLLGLDVHGRGVVLRVRDEGQVETLGVRRREAGVPVLVPLHRRPHAVAIAQVDVVAHPDLVAVVDDRRTGKGEQESVHELDPSAVVAEERREPAPDPRFTRACGSSAYTRYM